MRLADVPCHTGWAGIVFHSGKYHWPFDAAWSVGESDHEQMSGPYSTAQWSDALPVSGVMVSHSQASLWWDVSIVPKTDTLKYSEGKRQLLKWRVNNVDSTSFSRWVTVLMRERVWQNAVIWSVFITPHVKTYGSLTDLFAFCLLR